MWLSFALASAVLLAVRRVYEKELTARFGNFSLSLVLLAFALPPTLILFLFLPIPQDIFSLSWQFWLPLFVIWAVLYPIQNYFLYRSLREGELSHVTPVSALLPVFNIVPSYFIVHELPTFLGAIGIFATVVATYLLLTDTKDAGALRFNRPVLFMIYTIICTAIGSTLDKVAIEASTPVFYSFVNMFGACVVFIVLSYLWGQASELRRVKEVFWTLSLLGVVFALAFVTFTAAFTLGPTSYTLAIRSAGLLVAALWGVFFLKEGFSLKKKIALALFVAGTVALATG